MPDSIKELLLHSLPFIASSTTGQPQVSKIRLIEAVIGAAVAGAVSWFMIIPRMDERIIHQAHLQEESEMKIDKVISQLHKLTVDMTDDRFRGSDFRSWEVNHRIEHDKVMELMWKKTK